MTEYVPFPSGARRLLGLDVGDRRVGVAVSDPTGLLATPIEVYVRRGEPSDSEHIARLADDEGAEGVVVGLPINMNGTEGSQAMKVRDFADRLSSRVMAVRLWDERLSTVEAERRMLETGRRKRKGVVQRSDAEAAAVILESYLDSVRDSVLR